MSTPKLALKTLVISMAAAMAAPVLADSKQLPRIDVVGQGEDAITKQPGSVAIVTKEDLQVIQATSVQDALKTVPGITIRDEEGYGFIPNIGMRGLNPNRSQKVLVLEDGVPVAPGLFLANESYYSPRIERMERIEVLKGAAGLRYGPTTIGGVINYITKIPEDGVAVTAKAGSHGYRLIGLDAGGSNPSGDAFGGISIVKSQGDGFRNNGFDMTDIMVKGGMAIGDNQMVSAKFSFYENEINTSYVGLRPNEYKNNPTKNPAPNDYFITDRKSFDVNHELQINANTKLNTLVYWSQLNRDYWRQDVTARSADGTTFRTCDGVVTCTGGRNRTFEMMGVDSRLNVTHDAFGMQNESEIGVRLHSDSLSNKRVNGRSPNARSGVLASDDTQKANGIALYGQNRFIVSDTVAVTPGLRVETYSQSRKNELTGASGTSSNTEVLPGIGATWQIVPQAQVFAGAFKGFSPAMVATAISSGGVDQELEAERSTNFEMGIRGAVDRLSYEATAFHMDFENQIVPQSEAGGVGATSTNAGKTLHQGLEAALAFDFGFGWSADMNATYIPVSKYNSTKIVAGEDRKGNRLVYSPELTANFGVNYSTGGLKTRLSAYHVSAQFVDPENTRAESTDGRRGEIPAYTTFNLSAKYDVNKQLSLFGVVRNLTDEKYISGRNPDGIFPGAERNFELGARYKF
ncbi:outer membrane iron(III) dicitrate receptor [Thiomicrospira aerophila AL3]|uniref:Outer membrane iron(III) dicitrate receptor n=1 Tax=Thiomicrospira aerophila AL3 TaxID=717772 RepID=W0DZ11_9GAMM|nr:TonB-dependent siderophore receptor [Thiomicrospira aerophila]AHF02101.1 outer membrane iron(III) dicitrate receptor [Thiomicrospira aerophila AL3]